MAVVPVGLDRLKSQLLTSGLSQKDPALYQVINSLIDYLRQSNLALTEQISSGGSAVTGGITQLTGDVLAGPGSGSQVASIAPGAVTYTKIQDETPNTLLGRNPDTTGPPEEITLGDDLAIVDGILEVSIDGGVTPGIGHRVLSTTHIDSIPAAPSFGDLIYAGTAAEFIGTYYHGVLQAIITEDFEGIRPAYVLGFNNQELPPGNVGWGAPPLLDIINVELPKTWQIWSQIDGYLQALAIEDFEGIRAAYEGGVFGAGNGWGYAPANLETIPAPDPANIVDGAAWQRLPKGTNDQVLTMVDGSPQWAPGYELPEPLIVDTLQANTQVITPTIILDEAEIGIWNNVPYNAGDFTASGGTNPSWTVGAGNVACFRWTKTKKVAIVQVFLVATTVASDAGNVTELRIKIPNGMQAVGTPAIVVGAQENGVATVDIYCTTEPSTDDTLIFLRKYPVGAGAAFDQTPNGTFTGFTLIFEVV